MTLSEFQKKCLTIVILNRQSEDTGGNIDSYMFNILNNPTPAKMKEDNLDDPLSSVAIGNHKEKSDQLQVLVRHLWSNADHVTNQANHERSVFLIT